MVAAVSNDRIVLDRAKLRDALLYFIQAGEDDPNLGRTKLMKLMFYADFGHYQRHRRPITGAIYRKLPQGPVATDAMDALTEMERDGTIVARRERRGPHLLTRYTAESAAQPVRLSADEEHTLRFVRNLWADATTGAIVDASHRDAPWRTVPEMGDEIAYNTSILLPYRF